MAGADVATEADEVTDPIPTDDGGSSAAKDEHAWSELDPMMRFGVRVAGTLFCGVIVLAFFLVPYALLSNGWTPGP